MDLDSESESVKKEDDDDEAEDAGSTHDKEATAVVTGIVVDAWTEGGKLPPEPAGTNTIKLFCCH